jgi:hypothetical protein
MHKPTAAVIGALCVALATATHAGPSVYSNPAKATDLGSVHRFEADGPVTLTVAMKLDAWRRVGESGQLDLHERRS